MGGDIAELCDVMVRLLAHAARPDMDLVRIILEDEAAAEKVRHNVVFRISNER